MSPYPKQAQTKNLPISPNQFRTMPATQSYQKQTPPWAVAPNKDNYAPLRLSDQKTNIQKSIIKNDEPPNKELISKFQLQPGFKAQDSQQMIINQSRATDEPKEPVNYLPPPQQYPIKRTAPISKQLNEMKPPKRSYLKEIILLIILLILIGLLGLTIVFRETIISWFG